MPPQTHASAGAETQSATNYGQVIEYIQGMSPSSASKSSESSSDGNFAAVSDRLYLASYTHTPNANTPFPYPSRHSRSPSKRHARAHRGHAATVGSGPKKNPPVYFSVDHTLLYNAFHADFGPLHVGHLYRFAVQLHDVLSDPDNEDRGVVFWSHADARSEPE